MVLDVGKGKKAITRSGMTAGEDLTRKVQWIGLLDYQARVTVRCFPKLRDVR